jgi:hypothetical protein
METVRRKSIFAGVFLALALTTSSSVSAGIVSFADRDVFRTFLASNASTLTTTVEGWDTYPAGTIFPDGSTVNGITYNVSSSGDALVVSTGISLSPPNNLFMTNCPSAQACSFRPLVDTFTFGFPQPITAFGITFSSTFATTPGAYLLTTNLGDVIPSSFDPVFPGFGLGEFAGFVSTTPFTSVTVSSTVNALYGMDDLIFARPAAVPEPATVALLGLGLAAIGVTRRRKLN